MRAIFLFIILICNPCFSQSGNGVASRLALDGYVTLHISYTAILTGTKVKLGTYHSFPQNDVTTVLDTLRAGRKSIWIKSPVRSVGTSFLTLGDSVLTVLLIPGDTVDIALSEMKPSDPKQFQITFSGKSKAMQAYYTAKRTLFKDPIQHCMNVGIASPDLEIFKDAIDSTFQKMDGFWGDYRRLHPLPAWFVAYETNSIRYADAWLRLYMAWYQIEYQKKVQQLNPNYYDFMARVVAKNEKAMFHYDYDRFLKQYVHWKMISSNEKSLAYLSFVRKELNGNLGELFEIWELSGSADNPNRVGSVTRKAFSPKNQYLINYIRERSAKSLTHLKPGDKAPGFALVNTQDSLVSLSDFKGQVVYLSFWFTTCGACISEFPHENALVEKFKDKPVRIISICTYTPGVTEDQQIPRWKAASKRFGLRSIDLFANTSWKNTLTRKYIISSYPHYVLIGKDGNIIENFADRPSQGIAKKIEQALERSEK